MFSTWKERHAFLIGLFEVLCPRPSALALFPKSRREISKEYHYYTAGRALGFVALVFLLIGIVKFVQEVLL